MPESATQTAGSAPPRLPGFLYDAIRTYPGVRDDLVDKLPPRLGRVLDFGCATGALGAELVRSGKADSVCGVDLSPEAIRVAKSVLDEAYVVDLDRDAPPFAEGSFDSIIYGDILEHLKFPWVAAQQHRLLLKPDGRAFCSIPNVGNYRAVASLLRQRWDYDTQGLFDYTHLRYFTESSLVAMFNSAGYKRVSASPLYPQSSRARVFNMLTFGVLRGLSVSSWWWKRSTSLSRLVSARSNTNVVRIQLAN